MGFHNQLCTFHTLINLLVTNLFYIQARHWMIGAAKSDNNGGLQSVPWSVGRSLSDVTSASRGIKSKPANQTKPEESKSLKEIPSQANNWEASTCCEVYLKCSANLLEALWNIVNSSRSCLKNRLNRNRRRLNGKGVSDGINGVLGINTASPFASFFPGRVLL